MALIGFRGAGKTSIARHLAKIWKLKCVSLDDYIAQKAGKPISAIVADTGWPGFRQLEYECLVEVSQQEKAFLLDCGGGVVEGPGESKSQEKIDILKNQYLCIYCSVNKEKLLNRLARLPENGQRPPWSTGKDTAGVLLRRRPWYAEAASVIVDTSDVSAFDAARRIAELVHSK